MLDIDIKRKIKSGNKVSFYVPNKEMFSKIEKLLLGYGYYWRGFSKNRNLPSMYDAYTLKPLILFINTYNNKNESNELSLTNDVNDYQPGCDIILDDSNIDDWVLQLFFNEPDYKPKEKIIRML